MSGEQVVVPRVYMRADEGSLLYKYASGATILFCDHSVSLSAGACNFSK